MSDEPHLELLHDHHKDSFAYIVEREKDRERLLLILTALFALLALEIEFPIGVEGALDTVTVFGVEVNVDALPLPAFLTATWVLILLITLRYCRASVAVEKQYKYLHRLEDRISKALDGGIYDRESKAYEHDGKHVAFRWWTWGFYTVLLPILAATVVSALLIEEWTGLNYPLLNKVLDTAAAGGVLVSFVLYRTVPQIAKLLKRTKESPDTRKGSKETS